MPEKSEISELKDSLDSFLNVFLHNFERFNNSLAQVSAKLDSMNRQIVASNQNVVAMLRNILKEDREANIALLNSLLEKYSVATNQLSIRIGDLAGIRQELQKMVFATVGITDANFGQRRVSQSLTAGQLTSYNFDVQEGKILLLTNAKYGDITEDKIDVRYAGFNAEVENVRIDHELLSFETKFMPWIGMTSKSGKIVLKNNDTATQTFNAVYDYILVPEKQYRKVFNASN